MNRILLCLLALFALASVPMLADAAPDAGVVSVAPPVAPLPDVDSPAPSMALSDWKLVPVIGFGIMLLVWGLRSGKLPLAKAVPFLSTRAGGYLLLLLVSALWGIGSSLASGGAVTGSALYQAALAAVMAGWAHNALADAKGKP